MSQRAQLASDQRTYQSIGWTLLAGLVLSVAIMVVGLILAAIRGQGNISSVLRLDQEISSLSKGDANAVLDLGILLLFATPVAGVFVAFVRFWRQADRAFTLVTGLLLLLLVAAFAIALR